MIARTTITAAASNPLAIGLIRPPHSFISDIAPYSNTTPPANTNAQIPNKLYSPKQIAAPAIKANKQPQPSIGYFSTQLSGFLKTHATLLPLVYLRRNVKWGQIFGFLYKPFHHFRLLPVKLFSERGRYRKLTKNVPLMFFKLLPAKVRFIRPGHYGLVKFTFKVVHVHTSRFRVFFNLLLSCLKNLSLFLNGTSLLDWAKESLRRCITSLLCCPPSLRYLRYQLRCVPQKLAIAERVERLNSLGNLSPLSWYKVSPFACQHGYTSIPMYFNIAWSMVRLRKVISLSYSSIYSKSLKGPRYKGSCFRHCLTTNELLFTRWPKLARWSYYLNKKAHVLIDGKSVTIVPGREPKSVIFGIRYNVPKNSDSEYYRYPISIDSMVILSQA